MLILHGFAEHSGRYERVGKQFAEGGAYVASYDQIGHGKTEGTECVIESFEDITQDVAQHFADLPTEPRILLGHSFGGLAALSYTIKREPKPDLLVLSAPLLGANTPAWQQPMAPLLARVLPTLKIPAPIAGDQLSRDPEVGKAYEADPLVFRYVRPRTGYVMLQEMRSINERLGELSVPTLVLHGGADTLAPAKYSAPLGDLPHVDRRLKPPLRHELFNEPEGPELVAEVQEWISDQLDQLS